MVKGSIFIKMGKYTKGSGSKGKKKAEGKWSSAMEMFMKDLTVKDWGTAQEPTIGAKVSRLILVNLSKILVAERDWKTERMSMKV